MAKGSTFELDVLNLILAAKPIANIADNAASSPIVTLWMALHTADPSSGTGQNQSEIAYGGYGRVATTRSTAGWTASGSGPAVASPVSQINFIQANTTTTGTATFGSLGSSSSGTGKIYYSGALSASINVGLNVTPQITTATSITES